MKLIIFSLLITVFTSCSGQLKDTNINIIVQDESNQVQRGVVIRVLSTSGDIRDFTSDYKGSTTIQIDCSYDYLLTTEHKDYYEFKVEIIEPCSSKSTGSLVIKLKSIVILKD